MPPEENHENPLSDRLIDRLKNRKVIAYAVVFASVVGGVAATLDSIKQISSLIVASESDGAVPVVLPKNTGWLFVGYYNQNINKYTKGPYYKVFKTSYSTTQDMPRINEWIKLTAQRRIIISNFATMGLTKQFEPPWKKNILDDTDDTGLKLSSGAVIEVRDVSLGASPGRDVAVWVRVGSTE